METTFLLYSVQYGFFFTFLYDILRAFRLLVPHKRVWISLEDLGFWIYTAIQVFLMMQQAYNGSIRWFSILGGLTGILLYHKLVSPFFIHLIAKVSNKCRKQLGKAHRGMQKLGHLAGKKLNRLMTPFIKLRYGAERKLVQIHRRLKKKLTGLKKLLKMTI